MNAGLPGTGIGGLFYILLALLMPVRELYLTARRRSSRERWRIVLRQLTMAGGILGALAATGWLESGVTPPGGGGLSGASVLLATAAVAAVVLSVLVVTLRVWALLLGNRVRQNV